MVCLCRRLQTAPSNWMDTHMHAKHTLIEFIMRAGGQLLRKEKQLRNKTVSESHKCTHQNATILTQQHFPNTVQKKGIPS